MRFPTVTGLAAVAMIILPLSASAAPDDPLLTDPAGDVYYSAPAVSGDDRDYLDILAFNMHVIPDDVQDWALVGNLTVVDGAGFDDTSERWVVSCTVLVYIRIGESANGYFRMYATNRLNPDEMRGEIAWHETRESTTQLRSLPSTMSIDYDRPGRINWTIGLSTSRDYADSAYEFEARCLETMSATTISPPTPITNSDYVDPETGSFNFQAPANESAPEASSSSMENGDGEPSRFDATTDGSEVPSLAASWIVVGLLAVALLTQRHRER